MFSEKFTFAGSGGHMLSAQLDKPDGDIKAYALYANCFTCRKDLASISRISIALCERGIAVMRFDFTGLGMSSGDFSDMNFSSNINDLVIASQYMADNYKAPDIMIGHSLGGTATLAAAGKVESAKAVVTIAAPFDAKYVLHQFQNNVGEIEANGEAVVMLEGRQFKIKKQFIDDVMSQDMEVTIKALHKPLLVMHSPIDQTVPIDHARRIVDAAKHPKSFISLDHSDHLLLKNHDDGRYIAGIISAWVDRYLQPLVAA